MYENLRQAMAVKKVTSKQISELLGIAEKTVSNKLHGKTEWSYAEVVKLKKFIFPDTDWLFAFNSNVA